MPIIPISILALGACTGLDYRFGLNYRFVGLGQNTGDSFLVFDWDGVEALGAHDS